MPAEMCFGLDMWWKISDVNHAGKSSPAGGSWRRLFLVFLFRNEFTLNPAENEILTSIAARNHIWTFVVPEAFQQEGALNTAAR